MKLTREDIEKVAELARLELSEEEKIIFDSQLNTILGYFEKLKELGTLSVQTTTHASEINNVLREDKVGSSISNDESLLNAPDINGGCFRVPRVIE
ncbi:MAG: Asp-tRNA(Asn)/Glu-tRNA(Gln) amidotransferase subunit GatC [Thermodesulfobacteriota bacterium]|nr:Asp-tRNA(Asn)/Glu-tRNA(Gln) amidotransferase subunit GatC [Thermodesulfobacteriota bacterium]